MVVDRNWPIAPNPARCRSVRHGLTVEKAPMPTVVVRLDPRLLRNPDADLRYHLPDLLAERSGGVIRDDGYDYVGEGPLLVLFLKASELEPALACVLDVVQNARVLSNDLR